MKVKDKILFYVIPLIIVFALFMNLAFSFFFGRFIMLQEGVQTRTAVAGVSTYIQERFAKSQGTARDWGHWDDTYDFVETLHEDYIKYNLDESTFENLNINFMIFTNQYDEIVYQLYYSTEEHKFVSFPSTFELTDHHLSLLKLEGDVSSILQLGESFYYVSSTEITESISQDNPKGRFIIGREFISSSVEDLERMTGWKYRFVSALQDDSIQEPMDSVSVIHQTYSSDKKNIQFRLLVRNPYLLKDSILIDFEMPRTLYMSSTESTIGFALLNLLLFALAAMFLVTALTRFLTKPFDDLLQDVSLIDTSKGKYTKLAEAGGQEFFFLRKSINTLLRKIEDHQERITFMAMHDSLTGTPNRTLFNELLHQEIESAKVTKQIFGVVFIDLDEFKAVNDILGHEFGDELICLVVQRIGQSLDQQDMVARFGGDEFMLILKNVSDIDALDQKAAKLLSLFQTPFVLNGMEFFVTCSAGVAVYPTDGETPEHLLKNADIAMYNVKNKGKNNYAFSSPFMKEDVSERIELTNQLYRALERHEFEVYYQPQISVLTRKIVGFEALIRWNHPTKGILLPGKFISLAEHTRLINPIGRWVLETVCSQIHQWQDMSLQPTRIALNVSPVQFLDPEFLHIVQQNLSRFQIAPNCLEIEITESIATNKALNIEPILHELKRMGVSLAIDDFGSEYSSLSRLKTLSVDRIKMDMQFVQSISKSEKDDAIAKIIIQLAKNLNLKVMAEGIETETQMSFLKAYSCDEVQGFYYHQAMTAMEAERLLRKQLM